MDAFTKVDVIIGNLALKRLLAGFVSWAWVKSSLSGTFGIGAVPATGSKAIFCCVHFMVSTPVKLRLPSDRVVLYFGDFPKMVGANDALLTLRHIGFGHSGSAIDQMGPATGFEPNNCLYLSLENIMVFLGNFLMKRGSDEMLYPSRLDSRSNGHIKNTIKPSQKYGQGILAAA